MWLNKDKSQLPCTLPSSETLEASTNVRDLGVIMNDDLNRGNHIYNKVNIASRMCSLIYGNFQSRDNHTIILLFYTFAQLGLEYCCPLWFRHTYKITWKLKDSKDQSRKG